jgi:hypothetical protein
VNPDEYRAFQREWAREVAQAWRDLHDIPITPERRAKMEEFEKEIFNPELLVTPPVKYNLKVKCKETLTDEEVDQVLEESRGSQKLNLPTVVGDLHRAFEKPPEVKEYKKFNNLDDLFHGLEGEV